MIVHSPVHTRGRVSSDLAHQLAHIILDRDVRSIEQVGSLRFLTCDAEQQEEGEEEEEEEADWLAGCLLISQPLLLMAASQRMSAVEVAARHTSEVVARFRLNDSGVLVQIGRAGAARRRTPSAQRR